MASRYKAICALAQEESQRIVADADSYAAFLRTAANNYKYRFLDQLLIHAQKPEATACAEIQLWNRLGIWVNRGTTGIALLVEGDNHSRMRFVYDYSDTNSRTGKTITLWKMEQRYESSVREAVENRFGKVEEQQDFGSFLVDVSRNAVDDNLPDYLEQMERVCAGSYLDELDSANRAIWLKGVVQASVAYMTLYRCGLDPMKYITPDDLVWATYFNTPATVSVLGCASSSISEMILREIGVTVRNLQKQERDQIRTFESGASTSYNDSGRSDEHESDLYDAGRLPSAEPESAGGSPDWEIWNAAAQLPAQPHGSAIYRDAPDRDSQQPSGADRQEREPYDGAADVTDAAGRGSNGAAESQQPDGVGSADEQHPDAGGGGSPEGADLSVTLPSQQEQEEKIAEAEAEQASAFAISQQDIDAVLQPIEFAYLSPPIT